MIGVQEVSIIIPTYNEKENIGKLIPAIFWVFSRNKIAGEVIVVDDNSPDGTADIVKGLSKKFNVRLILRKRKSGLSSAVLEGIRHSKAGIIGVMDADLSHPPDRIPQLLEALEKSDIAIASRFVKGGGIAGWSYFKRLRSRTAALFAVGLTGVRDPMSGYFFFRKDVIGGVTLTPKGYKIGLEILVKGRHGKIAEIPYLFYNRRSGKSKLNPGEVANYLVHIAKLYAHKYSRIKRKA
ncbi:MAG: polyprenol monophosphomannose synthase [Candidatus Aenigmarchaeota archaeon]|nr:polyprenol monophosphomannose synthase [Candidatus Aenigmarchaeota archaeon]